MVDGVFDGWLMEWLMVWLMVRGSTRKSLCDDEFKNVDEKKIEKRTNEMNYGKIF